MQDYVIAMVEDVLEHLYKYKYAVHSSLPSTVARRVSIIPILLFDGDCDFLQSQFNMDIQRLYPCERFSELITFRGID